MLHAISSYLTLATATLHTRHETGSSAMQVGNVMVKHFTSNLLTNVERIWYFVF